MEKRFKLYLPDSNCSYLSEEKEKQRSQEMRLAHAADLLRFQTVGMLLLTSALFAFGKLIYLFSRKRSQATKIMDCLYPKQERTM